MLLVAALASDPADPAAGAQHASEHVLVKLDRDQSALSLFGATEKISVEGWHRIPVPEGRDPADVVTELESTEGVKTASLDTVVRLDVTEPIALGHVSSTGANDPSYPLQWHLSALEVESVWSEASGDGVVVAVIDTGVSPGGEDLGCHTFVSPYDAITGSTGIAAASDEHGHGTHVAGTVAQCTNNGVGVAGVAFDASIMPIKVLSSGGSGLMSDVAEGIEWARTHDADVVNLSLGCFCNDGIVVDAIDAAVADGVVIVAAAGNSAAHQIFFPANHPDVIGVGATDFNNARSPYSNRGPALSLVAPGGDLNQDANGDGEPDGVLQETFKTGEGWGYYFMHGTSMATPHVSGSVALLLQRFPDVDRSSVREIFEETALDLGDPGFDTSYGHGLVQVHGALVHDVTAPAWPTSGELRVDQYGETSLDLSWSDAEDDHGVTTYRVSVDGVHWSTHSHREAMITGLDAGTSYHLEVTARDRLGNWSSPLSSKVRTATIFMDTTDHLFRDDILWMSGEGITQGCNPPANDRYCPGEPVTRAQIAAFLVRALGLSTTDGPGFIDVPADSTFAADIDRLATAGITSGCNPPVNDRFCPDDPVTRAQAAAFLVRALGLRGDDHPGFVDVPAGSTFADDIGMLATAGITRGCNPPQNDRFCPQDPVTRGELAAFLSRALGAG